MIDFKANPFFLDDEKIRWVEETYDNMTLDEKIGQLFCPIIFTKDKQELENFIDKYHIGGMLYREGPGQEIRDAHKILQEASKIPLLTASNLEYGGNGSAVEGTYYGRQMLVAATNDTDSAYRLGKISCREGAAVGVNWAFAPVVDIDRNYHNPIMNVRTFGDDVQRVIDMGTAYIKAAKEEGVATAVKHFPGDGIDERDQHLLTSVNSLSVSKWDESYGRIYEAMIEAGTLSIMAGHIALPSYEDFYEGKEVNKVIPATLSPNLLKKLLRDKLGFNGLITTDATPMVGFCCACDRETAVPMTIESGCDVFLFNRNIDEDYEYMHRGYEKGILSDARLEEAVKRILATKAALGLNTKKEKDTLVPDEDALKVLNCKEHDRWARECADKGVTLVKDTQNLLPISPVKHKRILLQILGEYESNDRVQSFL